MDVISLGKANQAKRAVQKVNTRLGEGVQDIHENVKTRLEELEKKDPRVTLNNRVSAIEAKISANINKHNLRVSSILNKERYNMTEMIVDDFVDDSGIDKSQSFGYVFDLTARKIAKSPDAEIAEVVTVTEVLDKDPTMIVIADAGQQSEYKIGNRQFNLEHGVFTNTEFVNGKLQLKKIDDSGLYPKSGVYMSPVMDLGEAFINFHHLESSAVNGDSYKIFISSSHDGESFSNFTPIDEVEIEKVGRYVQLKVEIYAIEENTERIAHDFTTDDSSKWQANQYVVFDGSAKLLTNITKNMQLDESWSYEGTLMRIAIDKTKYKSIKQIEVI